MDNLINNIYIIPICIYNNFQKPFCGKASILLKKNQNENFDFIKLEINKIINSDSINDLEFEIGNRTLKINDLNYNKYVSKNDIYIIQHLIYNKEDEIYQYFPFEDIQLNIRIEKIVRQRLYDIIPFFKTINKSNLLKI